ncbi:hypothetical protein A0H81_14834 [Grifola frondosa]|uniref:Uncharacterized protein n=1 Tax=Grifola frondosa TaxID=5627 RepID=A0A1C7LML7_GRIFR|nr:hypothetical protein A0H81_14834 [Grifola frondosa]
MVGWTIVAESPGRMTGETLDDSAITTPHPYSLFRAAHGNSALPCAPSASADTSTTSSPAGPTSHGTGSDRAVVAMPPAASSIPRASSSVPTGSAQAAVRPQMPNTSTSAPAAGRQITELTAVLSLRQHQAFTPLQPDEWGHFLENAGLLPRYPNLLRSLRTGFIVGIPPIIRTVTPDNGPSIKMHEQEFLCIIEHELSVGRYLGPLSRAEVEILVGPFQSSPLSLIPKTEAGKLRLIQNFSFPKVPTLSHSSINSAIDSSDYPCTWGTFTTFCLVLSRLPPGSQGAVRDVAEAYRNLPLAASQWPGAVVRIADGDLFVIDTSASFGLRPNAGVYGNVDDAACDIFRAAGIGPISKWVDDHVFIRIRREFIAEYNQRRLE